MEKKYPVISAFENREDLSVYDSEAWGIFALELKFEIEDVHTTAVESITDGKNDRKCDIIYINTEFKTAIVAQSYFAERIKKAAKKNKASDLNTAAGWVLERDIEELPNLIRPKVENLRELIRNREIDNVEFWYIHNCRENSEISSELRTVELTAKKLVKQFGNHVKVRALEVGINTVDEWYKYSKSTILVTDKFGFNTSGGYLNSTDNWTAYSTSMYMDWFYYLIKEHGDNIFSANVRGYLGSINSSSNINNGIKSTASKEPENFLVFNNGITALVNDVKVENEGDGHKVTLEGISIVNGAQTTGAIGNLKSAPKKALVPVRFIKCNDPKVIEKIIRYNNSQNSVEPSDFRSSDPIQEKLRGEFQEIYPDLNYLGARRGGTDDRIKRKRNTLVSDQVAQSLTAFHGDPINATHYKSKIWEDDHLYAKIFNESTNAPHIVLVYSLYKALLDYKQLLKKQSRDEDLKKAEEKTLEFLSHVGSIYTIMAGLAYSLEEVIDKKVGCLSDVKFKNNLSFEEAMELWNGILKCSIPFVNSALRPILKTNVKKSDVIQESVEQFTSLIESTREANKAVYDNFAANILISKS